MAKAESTALVPVSLSPDQYPALNPETLAALKFNLAGEGITAGDLTRIKVPSGGATSWTIPNADGSEKVVKSVEGVIVHIAARRGFWASADVSGDPPDCTSTDLIHGHGTPGGLCETCPHNEWGSATKAGGKPARGKSCKERRLLFILRPGHQLPDILDVSPGSLKSLKRYLLSLRVPYCGIVSRFELTRTKSKDNIDYAQIRAFQVATLDNAAAESIRSLAKALEGLFSSVQVEADDETDAGPVEV